MGTVEPIPDTPAAIVDVGACGRIERALVVADYHAGLEVALRSQGVELPSHALKRRDSLLSVLSETGADRVVFLGDLVHSIGDPGREETDELEALLEAVTDSFEVPVTVVKGNHDGGIEELVDRSGIDRVDVTPTDGTVIGSVGFAHGHTWPRPDVLEAEVVCIGHEHPAVRLTDSVGGRRVERVWLRGALDPVPFVAHYRGTTTGPDGEANDDTEADGAAGVDDPTASRVDDADGSDHVGLATTIDGELVAFPAFNDLTGGTWVNVPEQGFLAPFLPDGLADGEAYLLDGTRLGEYRRV